MNPQLAAFLASWSWEPTVLGGLALAAGLYARGWHRLRAHGARALGPWCAWCYAAGLGVVGLALLSPLSAYSGLFFFLHMIQHLLLAMVAAPLLLLGAPLLPVLWAFPLPVRRELGRLLVPGHPVERAFGALTHPLAAAPLYLANLAVWHVPALYDAAQGCTATHYLQHLLFLATALLYWWPVVHHSGGRRRLAYAPAALYLLPPLFAGNAIGALLTFADAPLYATYRLAPRVWGLSALEDQQLSRLIMWIPGGMMYLIPLCILLALMLRTEERATGGADEGLVGPGWARAPAPPPERARRALAGDTPNKPGPAW